MYLLRRFLVALVLSFSASAWAQIANNTTLVGTVKDPSGGLVVGATVTAINVATNVSYTGLTNGEGYYSIPYVSPGVYDVTVQMAGFETVVIKGTIVQLNLAARTDITLRVGSTNSAVTISATNPPLSTDDAVIGETIDQSKVANLPIIGRRAMDLAATASNILIGPKTSYTGVPPGATYIGAGTREVHNSLTLDGITIMNSLGSSSSVTPNPDALSAVQTQTGNYTAQYGAYMGVHINMDTKAGTNQFHGTIYDYIQNDYFNARPWLLSKTSRTPVLRFNQFGGAIGGPVILPHMYNGRDRMFFMASYEGLRQISQSQSTATVLTQAMRNGDFSAIARSLVNPANGAPYVSNRVTNISPIATKLLAYMPLPNQPGTANNLNSTVPTNFTLDQTLDRVDYVIGAKVRLFARYSWQKLTYIAGSLIPTSTSYSPTANSNGAFGYTHIITPRFINDFHFGFNKLYSNVLNDFAQNNTIGAGSALGIPGFTSDVADNNPGIPSVIISNFQSLGSDNTNWYQDDRALHGYDQVSWTRSKHTIMAGVDLRKLSTGRAAQNAPRGSFTFNGQYSGYSAADFLTGYAVSVITPITQFKGSVSEWRDGFFVQDNWQATKRLTLLYGLRYELPTVPYSLNGYARIINRDGTALIPATNAITGKDFTPVPGFKFIGPNHTNWAPRFGLAYRATDKIVVRAGGGIFYNPNHLNSFTLATGNYPLATSFSYSGNTTNPANLNFSNPTGGQSSTVCVPGTSGCYTSVFTDNYSLPTPRLYQWNLDTGVELWQNAAFELQYLGSRGLFFDRSFYPNQPLPGAGAINARRPNQLFGQVRQIQNDSFSTYHGLTAILRQRLTHGFDMNLGYTWSHTLDSSTDANGGGTAMDQSNLKRDYGDSSWDIRSRFVGTLSYAMPIIAGFNRVANVAIGAWQANAIITLQTGMPFNIGISSDRANAGNLGTQRPDSIRIGTNSCSRSTVITAAGTSCINAAAFGLPALYTYGNLHRNDQHGPGFINTNLSLFKNFAVHENVTVQFRMEAFNVFNHANPGNPNATLPASFDPAAPNYGISGSNFGTITTVQNASQNGGGQRLLQLAGKINF
jgi:hypothetical protein